VSPQPHLASILAIDTSSHQYVAVAACDADGGNVRGLAFEAPRDHSHRLLPAVAEITNGDLSALTRVVVVRGPGSFAGLRVGIASGKGLALARGATLVGIGTMEAVAAAAGGHGVAGHPIGRGEVAIQPFDDGTLTGATDVVAESAAGHVPGIVGEGMGALGGREVAARERCLAALELGRRAVPQSAAPEPIYLRDPRITAPRASAGGARASTNLNEEQ
jgi:tRNA threonylcarbamoyl adenosine modification protein YeaZ